MRLAALFALAALAVGPAACAAAAPEPDPLDLASFLTSGGRSSDVDVAATARSAAAYPLGSQENPVRAHMPGGQQAYLARLRCADGRPPAFSRAGNFGPGVYGSIIDGYEVVCPGSSPAQSMIFMDMYHPNHVERAAPPGFTIVP